MVTNVARLSLQDYMLEISAEGDILREFQGFFHFAEQGFYGSRRKMGGVGLFDTSKGTYHEFLLAYKLWSAGRMKEELAAMNYGTRDGFGASPDNLMRLMLGWDPSPFLKIPEQTENRRTPNWQSTTSLYELSALSVADLPLFLSDWTPAEYVSGIYNPRDKTVNLRFRSHTPEPCNIIIYSGYKPEKFILNGSPNEKNWKYDPLTGWLLISPDVADAQEISFQLGDQVAPLHPYFSNE